MRYLIDTHVFIWYAIGDARISQKAIGIIDSEEKKYISIASLWEMAIKVNIGKLHFSSSFEEVIDRQLEINKYKILPITKKHLTKLSGLGLHHKDPFDRLIICQSLAEGIPIVTVDSSFSMYEGVHLLW
ncbi:MAG: type II toxin-antitoxin system VapC family toxin [Bacteroidota bacterium]